MWPARTLTADRPRPHSLPASGLTQLLVDAHQEGAEVEEEREVHKEQDPLQPRTVEQACLNRQPDAGVHAIHALRGQGPSSSGTAGRSRGEGSSSDRATLCTRAHRESKCFARSRSRRSQCVACMEDIWQLRHRDGATPRRQRLAHQLPPTAPPAHRGASAGQAPLTTLAP